ncbi:Nif11-like leader peptide family natural product precursor [Trichocoleus sp. Lan]|uniref:Nif11-like leader peptide family natural product precursor n=1 Tax=Trichocoleus sp. Lan TaxID=2933927 RepID=UPI003299D90A
MAQESAASLFKAVKEDQALQAKLKATTNPETFIQIARERGYDFTVQELNNEIENLSEEELASVINPGIGPRRHLTPR